MLGMMRIVVFGWMVATLISVFPRPGVAFDQRAALSELTQQTAEAGRLYARNQKGDSAEVLKQVIPEFTALLREGDEELRQSARLLYQRLARARELFEKDRIALPKLPSWESLKSSQGISFSATIAPLLQENCNGCHIGGQRASGGLRLDSFAQLMQGGMSGPIIDPENPEQSLLIRKLNGQAGGQRMPAGGRPPLSETDITRISEWIRQGALLDSSNPNASLEALSRQSRLTDATHEELFSERKRQVQEMWKLAFPDQEPNSAESPDLFILGNPSPQRLVETQRELVEAMNAAGKLTLADKGEPLLRGGLAAVVLRSRYDYSEFGRMVERRELPRTWLGHWRADSLLPVVVLIDEEAAETPVASVAAQTVLAATLGSFQGVPYWFAEGVARQQVSQRFRRKDPRIDIWLRSLPEALSRVSGAEALVEGKLDEETMGLVGMAIAETMLSRLNRQRFQALMEALRNDLDFNQAMTQTFGPTELFLANWLNK
jgi:hypothetical protein